jgi:Peptidase S46
MKRICLSLIAAVLASFIIPGDPLADEGMWLFNNPPARLLKEKYNFSPTRDWLEQVQRSSVRFNSGGSGSFVSADGLVMTNHHVGADSIQKLGNQLKKDFMKTGFHAKTHEEELKCVDEELNVLVSIEDITQRVNAAVKSDMGPAEAQKARRAVINTIEKDSLDRAKLRSDVVTLYNGGAYHLYRYKKYTEVRMVFAPEKDAAFFGGDPDNFEFPRFDLDVCFFRVYENDKPAKIEHYLRWSKEGCQDGELIFVSGHPGRSARLNTMTHLESRRDLIFPFALNLIRRREVLLKTYSDRSSENARRAEAELFGYQNARKAYLGMLAGLQDPAIMNKKRADERALRDKVAADGKLKESYGDAWDRIAASVMAYKDIYFQHSLLETPFNFVSTADIIGGNSGSPVINRNGEVVGIIFDGNIHSLVLDFIYTDEQARAVAVDSAGIMESLRSVYDAEA